MRYVFYFLLSAVVAIIGTVSGIGGGVIIKPVMDALSGMDVSSVSFLSGCTVLAMSAVSVLRRRGDGEERNTRRNHFLAVGAAAGGVAGKTVFALAVSALNNDHAVGAVQNAVMIVLTSGVLLYARNKEKIHTLHLQSRALSVGIGLMLGMISAFLGIGGGPVNLIVLYYFFSMDTKTAARNSLYIIFLSQLASLCTAALQKKIPTFDTAVLLVMVVGGLLGGYMGCAAEKRITHPQADKLFRRVLAVIILISFYNLIHYIITV